MATPTSPTTSLVLFDDGHPLSPLTDLRPSFDIRTGALTTLERFLKSMGLPLGALFVPRELEAITKELHPGVLVNQIPPGAESILLINGRCPLADGPFMTFDKPGQICTHSITGHIVAAMLDAAAAKTFLANGCTKLPGTDGSQHDALLQKPWHWRKYRDACIAADLELLAEHIPQSAPPPGTVAFGSFPLHIVGSAKIFPTVTFDLEHGPIVIDDRATIRPGAILVGPCYIGCDSHVLDRAFIKANTAIGPHCKFAGEVGGTIVQGFSNKAHDGHLGDSFLGEWVNLGAGTTNSNLLNTYGEVICKATADSSHERSGETFLGATIGDHVKTAICTRIMTGSILHMGSMFAQSAAVSGTVSGFTWSTDAGAKQYRFEKFLEVATAAMSRRKLKPSHAYTDLLKLRHSTVHGVHL